MFDDVRFVNYVICEVSTRTYDTIRHLVFVCRVVWCHYGTLCTILESTAVILPTTAMLVNVTLNDFTSGVMRTSKCVWHTTPQHDRKSINPQTFENNSHKFSTRRNRIESSSPCNYPTFYKMKICAATLALLATGASAFTPSTKKAASTELAYSKYWTPDPNAFAQGLPGSLAPVGEFDPLGFAKDADLETLKVYREAELQHGRVAMLGALGMLVTEEPIEFHPLFQAANKDIGPAIRHLDEVRAVEPYFFFDLAILIGTLELNRALVGWQSPGDGSGRRLKEDYFPGDIGFDPLGLKPEDNDEFLSLHTKELQNGRLAMLGWAGMVAQELVNGQEIFVNLGLAEDRFDPSKLPVQF